MPRDSLPGFTLYDRSILHHIGDSDYTRSSSAIEQPTANKGCHLPAVLLAPMALAAFSRARLSLLRLGAADRMRGPTKASLWRNC